MTNHHRCLLNVFLLCTLTCLTACKKDEQASTAPEQRWQKIVEMHPVEKTRAVQMMITAENQFPSQTDLPAMVLSCQTGQTEAYIIWRQYLGAYDLDVTWRSGSETEITETWSLSTDSEAIFAPDAINFIKQMMLHDVMLVKAAPFGTAPLTLVFNTDRLAEEISELREACNW